MLSCLSAYTTAVRVKRGRGKETPRRSQSLSKTASTAPLFLFLLLRVRRCRTNHDLIPHACHAACAICLLIAVTHHLNLTNRVQAVSEWVHLEDLSHLLPSFLCAGLQSNSRKSTKDDVCSMGQVFDESTHMAMCTGQTSNSYEVEYSEFFCTMDHGSY